MSERDVLIPVDRDSSTAPVPWSWLDWGRVWKNGDGVKVQTSHAPKDYCPECVVRVWCRLSPEGRWDDQARFEDGDLYVPPTTALEGRAIVAVKPERDSDGMWWWRVTTDG